MNKRIGFTLVELLITIAIITVLAAIALPTLKNSLREQRLSRSAGLIAQYIEEARARAIGTGRPVGVILERNGTDNEINRSQITRLRICTTPPHYTGDLGGTKAYIKYVNRGAVTYQRNTMGQPTPAVGPFAVNGYMVLVMNATDALLLAAVAQNNSTAVKHGDIIMVGPENMPRKIIDIRLELAANPEGMPVMLPVPGTGNERVEVVVEHSPPGWIPSPFDNAYPATNSLLTTLTPINFGVQRQPSQSYIAPLEVSQQTAIDLLYSGIGPEGSQFSPLTMEGDMNPATSPAFNANNSGTRDYMPIWIVFAPDGSLHRIYMADVTSPSGNIVPSYFTPLGDVHLLVGRTGQVRPESLLTEDAAGRPNVLDGQAVWVTINRMSGNVSSSPNSVPAVVPASPPLPTVKEFTTAVSNAREYARHPTQGT